MRVTLALAFALLSAAPARAQLPAVAVQPRITSPVDATRTVTLRGNTHPFARSQNDLGPAPASQAMSRMMLVLRPSDTQQTALTHLLAAQQDPSSPQFHHWLTPTGFGSLFGPFPQDIATITAWLRSQGFQDIHLDNGRRIIEFSGAVENVDSAFHLSIHHYAVRGHTYSANASDPQIPEALAPVVAGIVSLHNFPRHMHSKVVGTFARNPSSGAVRRLAGSSTAVHPLTTITYDGDSYYPVTPYDFATIYNVLPLWNASASIDGTGQTIAIVGETDINPQDFVSFRSLFNLPLGDTSGPTGTQFLNIIHNGPAPGLLGGEETEADLDTQWSSAVAKGATIDFVVSASTETAAGVDLSAEYIIDNNLAPVMSTSYGECELYLGTAANAFYNALYQQAAAEGITVMTSSGDSGSAGCDLDGTLASQYGLGVSGLNSTPYNVSVGGTDFFMPGNAATYWNATNNSTTYASAKSYIPEIPWNDSCANPALGSLPAFSGMSPAAICSNSLYWYAPYDLLTVVGGGGGQSACTQSDGSTAASCAAPYPKPSWQTGPGVPADGVRDVPDVSLFAGNGEFGAFYLVCEQDATNLPCQPAISTSPVPEFDFVGLGGTSASSPAFAAIMALVNQQTGTRQGNANYVLYKLAAQQSSTGCNSSSGSGASCIFNDITTGSNVEPCVQYAPDCTLPSPDSFYGTLSGYTTGAGYDLASGLGSVNVANLVHGWSSATRALTTTTLKLTPQSALHGSALTAAISVSSTSGTPTGLVSLNGNAPNGSVGSATLADGQASPSFDSLPGGSYLVTAHYAGDSNFAPSDSTPISVSISPEPSVETFQAKTFDTETGAVNLVTTAAYGSLFILRANVAGKSGFGTATGTVTLTDNGQSLGSGSYPLNGEGAAEDTTINLDAGQHTLGETYSGDPSFLAGTGAATLTVTPMPMSCTYQANTAFLRPGWGLNLGIFARATPVHSTDFFYIPNGTTPAPIGTLSVYEGSTLIGGPYPPSGSSGGGILPCDIGGCYNVPEVSTQQNIDAPQIQEPLQPITVTYSGDSNHAACTSPPLTLTYETGPVASYINTYIQNYQYPFPENATAIFNVSVSPSAPAPAFEPAYPAPTGTIQISVDNTPSGSPFALGPQGSVMASLSTTGLTPGDHTITFAYSGDSNFLSSTGPQYDLYIAPPDFSLNPPAAFLTVTNGDTSPADTIDVASISGFTGTVTFSCSGLPRGASCVFSPTAVTPNGSTNLTIATTKASVVKGAPGSRMSRNTSSHTATKVAIFAILLLLPFASRRRRPNTFLALLMLCLLPLLSSCGGATSSSGGGGGGGGGGGQGSLGTSYIGLSANPSTPMEGSSVTLNAGITGTGTSTPATGAVTFYIDNSSTGATSQVVPAGNNTVAASYTTSLATPGTHTITANYSGDSTHGPATASLQLNVGYASGTAPGLYTVTITGVSGNLTHTAVLNLTVQ